MKRRAKDDTWRYLAAYRDPSGRKRSAGSFVTHRDEVFGDDVVAAAMIDRLVHHAVGVALKGDSCRLKDRDLGRVPAAATTED